MKDERGEVEKSAETSRSATIRVRSECEQDDLARKPTKISRRDENDLHAA